MQFIDEAKVFVKSGTGGDGCLSFRREANVPRGGPDGGDGGRGGHVIIRCIGSLNTLIDYRYQQHFKAKRGGNGQGKNRYGAKAKDIYLDVPVGTQVFDTTQNVLLADMMEVGQELTLLEGGKGGYGNTHFKTSVNQAPRRITKGGEPQEMWIWLKLKLLSDAGLLGLPNAGKSTFLSAVSRARPKIADYPFTTLKPQLGVVYVDEKEFVVADIPGLIAGASQGVGLGIRFLKHVERCRVLLHLIDVTQDDVVAAYQTICNELHEYSEALSTKTEVVALTKIDAVDDATLQDKKQQLLSVGVNSIFAISSISGDGVQALLRQMLNVIDSTKESEISESP